jgi:hypothetical protein
MQRAEQIHRINLPYLREESLLPVPPRQRDLRRTAMASGGRAAVSVEVLGAGDDLHVPVPTSHISSSECLHVSESQCELHTCARARVRKSALRVLPLHATDVVVRQGSGEVRALPIRLLCSPPPRVSYDIDLPLRTTVTHNRILVVRAPQSCQRQTVATRQVLLAAASRQRQQIDSNIPAVRSTRGRWASQSCWGTAEYRRSGYGWPVPPGRFYRPPPAAAGR